MTEEKKETTIELEENSAEDTEQESATISVEEAEEGGFSKEEVEAGKSSGVIVDKKPEEKKEESEEEEPKKEEAEKGEDKNKETDLDDDPEKEAETLQSYNANEKALYFRQKKARKQRQAAERKAELLEVQRNALERENELLKKGKGKDGSQSLEDLEQELDKDLETADKEGDDDVVTKGDLRKERELQEARQEARQKRAREIDDSLNERYQTAREKDENFDKVCDLAKEIMNEDKKEGGTFAVKLVSLASDPKADITGYIYRLAKLHDKYAEVAKGKENKGDPKKVEKIVDNANKRTTSAAVGGGSGRRIVSEKDLTVEDCRFMTDSQWGKLSKETRDRILKESCKAA